ncbi:ABC transporter permease subunit [Saliphagus infecundisoli]|uniref:ABC transporter permease n=1 Tax=Saliphagus infecundisoli TaxID=1849069 RepID=A0ABD5QI14_9EURY|nr:ABC transporter permease subunit [Saliphagus infecundisoli]
MLEIVRYEAEKRLTGTLALAVGLGALAVFFVAFFPSFADVDMESYAEAFPPAFREAFGIEAIGTIEGFLAVEVYQFLWVLLLGLYVAYLGAGAIATDVERDRMDLLLSLPVSRSRVLGEKFLALAVPILVLNAVVPLAVYGGVIAVGESIDAVDLAMVHLLSIPYLLACAAIGLLLSTLVDRADVAQRAALAAVFALFLVDSISASAENLEWIGGISPTAYYDPSAILVDGSHDLGGAVVLLGATTALVVLASIRFRRADVGA